MRSKKYLFLIAILVLTVFLVGCAGDISEEKNEDLETIVEKLEVKSEELKVNKEIRLEVYLANKDEGYSYDWQLNDTTAGSIDADGKKAVYIPNKPGKHNIKVLISAENGEQISLDKELEVKKVNNKGLLTADYSKQLMIDNQFKVVGEVTEQVKKIKVKIDGYYLTDRKTDEKEIIPDSNGNYSLTYKFDSAKENRRLVIEAYDDNGNMIDKIAGEVDIFDHVITVDSPKNLVKTDLFQLSGEAIKEVKKIKVKVDGYYLKDKKTGEQVITPDDKGNYNLSYNFDKAKESRELVVEAYGGDGNKLREIKKEINVLAKELTADYHKNLFLNEEFEVRGTVIDSIDKIKVKVDGYYLTDERTGKQELSPDDNGYYSLNYKFDTTNQERELVIEGYTNDGKKLASITDNINIMKKENQLNVNVANEVELGEKFSVKGDAYYPIETINITIDGYSLVSGIQVKNDSYESNEIELNNKGLNRKLVVKGYNEAGNLVKEITKNIDVISKNIIDKKEQYDYAVGKNVWKVPEKKGFFYTAEMTIDADGAPKAYHENDSMALDYLANAGYEGNWWGIATNSNGDPYVQDANDPAPGYYVSTTALIDSDYHKSSPSRYVNSTKIPFFVLPGGKSMGAELGDYGVVYNKTNGKMSYAIYGDIGPTDHLGEGSIALAKALDISSSPKTGGIHSDDIVYLVFPNSGIGQGYIPSKEKIQNEASNIFKQWGGIKQLQEVLN